MNASELFKAGQLQDAIDAQVKEVKANPADHGKRIFLFELLVFAGDLDRARKHLDAVKYDDPELEAALHNYRQLLDAEQRRRELFRSCVAPGFLVSPPESVAQRLQAVLHLGRGETALAAEALARAEASRPALSGECNGKPFTWFRDADDLFGDVVEVMSQGNYYWVPLSQVDLLVLDPPRFPRDLIWAPARLEIRNGPAGGVFLSALYPGSHEHPDDRVKLGRLTEWKPLEDDLILGVGAKTVDVEDEEMGLLELRQVVFA